MNQRIFISSVQREFAKERRALAEMIRKDMLLGTFFDVFLFEEMAAQNRSAKSVYLDEVRNSDIYLGLFGCEYGFEDAEGVSPTEREYDLATECGKYRLAFVKRTAAHNRMPKERHVDRQGRARGDAQVFLVPVDAQEDGLRGVVPVSSGPGCRECSSL